MRLIDADLFIQRIESYNTLDEKDKALYNFALNEIVCMPTVEQPQAEWIVYNYPAHECTYCSNCKAEYDQIELYLGGTEYPSYCPSCGAKMTW